MKVSTNYPVDVARATLGSFAEALRGVIIHRQSRQPEQLLELYDIESCPFCRLVRETLTELDLDAIIHPCPKGGSRFRPTVIREGGERLFPFLRDPNTGLDLYESADIVRYLYETYGGGDPPAYASLKGPRMGSSVAVSALSLGHGVMVRPSRRPEQPLELYSFESSPFSRLVRERLCEMEIPYILRNCGRNQLVEWLVIPALRERVAPNYAPVQRNRRALMARTGRMQVPYLVDPNTGEEMYESARILRYLERTYGA